MFGGLEVTRWQSSEAPIRLATLLWSRFLSHADIDSLSKVVDAQPLLQIRRSHGHGHGWFLQPQK